MAKATFAQMDREASMMLPTDPACAGVNHIIAHAADNARTSRGRMASLVDLLSGHTPSAPVVAWFKERGVEW